MLRIIFIVFLGFAFQNNIYAQPPEDIDFTGQPNENNFDNKNQNPSNLEQIREKFDKSQDSLKIFNKDLHFTNLRLNKNKATTLPIDTAFNKLLYYTPFFSPTNPRAFIGHYGSPHIALIFRPNLDIGFRLGNTKTFDGFTFYDEEIPFHRVPVALTNIRYINGAEEEQNLEITHTRNIDEYKNYTLSYNRYQGAGAYKNTDYDHLKAYFSFWYLSKNNRYQLYTALSTSFIQVSENGSVVDQSFFDTKGTMFEQLSREQLDTKLSNAVKKIRNNTFFIKSSYYLGKVDKIQRGDYHSDIIPTTSLSYIFKYKEGFNNFFKDEELDSNKLIFPDPFDGSTVTNSNLNIYSIHNNFYYSFILKKKKTDVIRENLKIKLGFDWDFYSISQNDDPENIGSTYQFKLNAELYVQLAKKIYLEGKLSQIITGFQEGDSFLSAKLAGDIRDNIHAELGAIFSSRSPSFLMYRTYNNHYRWDGRMFNREKIIHVNGKIWMKKWKLGLYANSYLLSDYLFWGEKGQFIIPDQHGGNIYYGSIGLEKKFNYKGFHVDNVIQYQRVLPRTIVRTPEVYISQSIYFITPSPLNRVLKYKAHQLLKIGVDIRYHTAFQNYSYDPLLNVFYAGSGLKYPTYPTLDAFLIIRFKKANFLLTYTHLDEGWFSKYYFTVARYPMPDRAFKFGVEWKIFD